MARRLEPHEADRHLAAAARLRRVLRHDHRRRQLLRPEHADARQRQRRARGERAAASSTPTRSATRPWPTSSGTRGSTPARRSSSTSPTPRRTGRCTRTTKTSPSTAAASTPAGTRCARQRLDKLVALRPPEGALEAHRARPDPAAVDRGRAGRAVPRLDAALHGGLRRADRPHGPGHRPHHRRAREERPAGRHARHLPRRQRRLRRGHPGRRHASTSWSTS